MRSGVRADVCNRNKDGSLAEDDQTEHTWEHEEVREDLHDLPRQSETQLL